MGVAACRLTPFSPLPRTTPLRLRSPPPSERQSETLRLRPTPIRFPARRPRGKARRFAYALRRSVSPAAAAAALKGCRIQKRRLYTKCNTGDPGLEGVVGLESIWDSLHRLRSSLMARTLRSTVHGIAETGAHLPRCSSAPGIAVKVLGLKGLTSTQTVLSQCA